MLRLYKDRKKVLNNIDKVLKISAGFERLYFFLLLFMLFGHIISCLWVFVALMTEDGTNWIELQRQQMIDNGELSPDSEVIPGGMLYAVSMYYVVTTITTVGYGDISATNTAERVFSQLLMIVGVIGFSFASGSLSSIMSSYDAD